MSRTFAAYFSSARVCRKSGTIMVRREGRPACATSILVVQSAAREKILHGALALVDALPVTLSAQSKCVLIEKK